MADLLLPPNLTVARASFKYLDSTGVSRGKYSGLVRTASLGGDRLGATLAMPPQGGATAAGKLARAQLIDFMASLRGRQNRAMLWDRGYTMRGSFPTVEAISNGDFSSGTTGWLNTTGSAIAVLDQALRVTRVMNNGTANGWAQWTSLGTFPAFTPFAWRFAVGNIAGGALPYATVTSAVGPGGCYSPGTPLTVPGVTTAYGVSGSSPSGNTAYLDNQAVVGAIPLQSYYDVLWASFSRCILSDAPDNLVPNSSQINGVGWTATAITLTNDVTAAPNGATAGDRMTPDTTSANHGIRQTISDATGNGWTFFGAAFKANGYNFVTLQMIENTGSTTLYQVFNITTGAGAVGVTNNTGANWADRRAAVVDLGNGWYFCGLLARITNGATSYDVRILPQNADNVSAFTGDGTSGIFVWLPTVQRSGAFAQLVSTTTAATGTTYGAGTTSMNVKGLPTSTAALLLPTDQVEIITSFGSELKIVTASLDSDAGGRGVLQFIPPLRGTVANNQPIIVSRPLGKFVYSGSGLEWATDPGIFTGASFDFEEAPL